MSQWRGLARSHFLALGAIACIVAAASACGPFFPNQVLAGGSESLLQIPDGRFVIELEALNRAGVPPFKVGPGDSTKVDVEEISEALAAVGKPDDALLAQYAQIRKRIEDHTAALEKLREDPSLPKPPPMENVTVPQGLPLEFDQYIRGLIAFHRDDTAGAQKIWKDLLALPADQRSHRSIWAAFMLGKSYMKSDAGRSIDYFRLTRKLAGEGFVDSLGLASSSLGWEARVELDGGGNLHAISLYLRQRWTGDRTADESLRECAAKVFAGGPGALAGAAGDADARQVVTAYLICNAGRFHSLSKEETKRIPAWLAAVESAAVQDMPGADRLAWLAYRNGDFALADRWVARSPGDSAVANWVRAKLLLRDGKTDEAARVLVKVVRSFPQADLAIQTYPEMWGDTPQTTPRSITTDLGVLQLARGQFTDSMRLLMMSDHWRDAAYIAECVLTSEELKAFVDRFCPTAVANKGDHDEIPAWDYESNRLRLLLARRLARDGQWKIARDYFTADVQATLDHYIAGMRIGHDKTKPDAERAAAYLSAAHIAHKSGMELLGTELSPDFAIHGGSYQIGDDKARLAEKGLASPSADELDRYQANAPEDTRRFHYRYIASEHAWNAAELMPDDDENTAKVLNDAGCWIKDKDPDGADKFYKALVRRCPDTELGKAAADAHWFPKVQAASVKE